MINEKWHMKYFFYFFILFIIPGCVISGCVNHGSADIPAHPPEIVNCENQTILPYQFPIHLGFQKNLIISNETKKPEYISTTVNSPAGRVTINAWVSDSATSIPLVRFNESRSLDISLDRSNVANSHPSKNITEDRIKEKIISESLPDENEASILAKKDLQPFGGLPQDASAPVFRKNIGGLTAIFSLIQYSHSINGLPVESSFSNGDHIMMEFGQNGELISLNKMRWRDVDYIQNVPVISVNEALTRLQKGMYSGYPSKNSMINSIKLGYFYTPETSDIPEPVWIFSNTDQVGLAEYYVYAAEQGPVAVNISQTLPKPVSGRYSNNAMLHNTSAKKPVTGEEAVNIVYAFEGNSISNVTYRETVHVKPGCGEYSYDYLLLSSDKGRFEVFPDTGEIMDVEYSPIMCNPPIKPLNASQALMVSQNYLEKKFNGFEKYPSAFVVQIRENNETFHIDFPDSSSKSGTRIVVSKNTGQVINYNYEDMIEHVKC
jgi:hypothetical protein